MDKMLNSKNEKDSIYEIYRACRLCGGGAGYKMPIIQSIVELDGTDVELKQKIRDCVQIEVTQDDKMPPLICELCVDKVNDFYEFLEMCRQTNTRTRLRLGLPPQALARGTADAGDCILGLTEPVFVEDSDAEVDSKNKKAGSKAKGKKDPVVKIKVENLQERRSSQSKKREPTPPRTTRNKSKEELPQKNLKKNKESTPPRITRNSIRDDDEPLNSLKDSLKPSKAAPKSILKKESSFKKEEQREERASRQKKKETTPVRITRSSRDDDLPLNNLKSDEKSKLKRSLEKEVKTETPPKKVKIALKPMTSPVQKTSKSSSDTSHKSGLKNSPGPRSKTRPTRSSDPVPEKKPSAVVREPSPIPEVVCDICQQSFKTIQGRSYHWKTHTVGFTDPKLACNPCGEWFPTQKEAVAHHDFFHITTPYSCENCYSDFKTLTGFDDHLKNNECIPMYVAPDVKCDVCWEMFPTYTMLYSHDCPGEEHRPGGKCAKCNRSYALYKNLVKHESSCTARKKGELIVDQSILDKLKPVKISLQRCDNLVPNKEQYKPTYKGSDDYDSDDRYHPYRSQCRLKAGFRGMVKIHDEIKKVLCSQDYVHWDSAGSDEDDVDKSNSTSNSVHSLVALTLKTIFSQRLVGRVPRRKRRVKIDKVFDSLQADDDDLKVDISNIINKLCEDDEEDMSGKNVDNNVSEKYDGKNSFDDVKNSIDSNNTKDNAKSLSENDDSVNDIDNNDLTLKKTDDNDSLKTLSVNDKQNLHTNDTVSEKDSQDYDKINNDSKESQLMNQLNSDVDGKCENDVNHKGKSELVRSNDFDDSLSNNDNINTNDKDSIDDILPKTLESKTSLGINDFSFDTI